MWNDEDNNPYGTAFDRSDSVSSPSVNPASPSALYNTSSTSGRAAPAQAYGTTADDSDEEYETVRGGNLGGPKRKKGGYDSRVEQFVFENPDVPIVILDAGKSLESGGNYIVYTIRTGDLEVRRRYSEFATLRDALVRLHPTLVIPPIPEKHSISDYAAAPTSAKQDQQIIDLRKRMLAVFLNRCRRMEEVRADGVWWRFLDPNSSWNEVLHTPPVSTIPKNIMKAPPLDTPNPTTAHGYLPIPNSSAKLKTAAAQAQDGKSIGPAFGRLPADTHKLSEQELDPYFISYEASIKDLEHLLTGPMEKVNRRTLSHLLALAADLSELGAKYNAFALSEQAPTLGPAIEKVGQAADMSYIATQELASSLQASFAEPMRENAQFAGVVRSVLRYRVMKRAQQELTYEDLHKKRALLDQLERSEAEARRIDQHLSGSAIVQPPKRSTSLRDTSHHRDPGHHHQASRDQQGGGAQDDAGSVDSDFPPTHGDFSATPSARQGAPERGASSPVTGHRKMPSANSFTNRLLGPIRQAVQGVVDHDPERTRRDMIGKTREAIGQLEQAQVAVAQDVTDASASVLRDLKRFQGEKEDDLKRYMLAFARSQIEWAKKNKETWEDAREEVAKIEED